MVDVVISRLDSDTLIPYHHHHQRIALKIQIRCNSECDPAGPTVIILSDLHIFKILHCDRVEHVPTKRKSILMVCLTVGDAEI